MLTRIRNANQAVQETVEMPHSNIKNEIARIMKKEGYILDYTTEGHGGKRTLRLYLKYTPEQLPVLKGLRRISRPGLRRYVPVDNLPRVLGGMGTAIISTSAGLLTSHEARRRNVGGEVMCYIW
jgi:small subunit ribosomal protein S8